MNPVKTRPGSKDGHLELYKLELEAQGQELRSSRQLLEETLQLYADLYDYAAVSCLTLSNSGCIKDANITCGRLLQRPRDQLIGLPLARWLDANSVQKFFVHMKKCRESERPRIGTRLSLSAKIGGGEVLLVSITASSKQASLQGVPDGNNLQSALIDLTALEGDDEA